MTDNSKSLAQQAVEANPNITKHQMVERTARVDGIPVGSLMAGVKFTPEQLFNMGDDEVKLKTYLEAHNMEVRGIVGFYARWSDNLGKDNNGDASEGYQVVLITKQGEAIRISAQILVARLQFLFSFMGLPETWKEPINMKFRSIEVPRGTSYSAKIIK